MSSPHATKSHLDAQATTQPATRRRSSLLREMWKQRAAYLFLMPKLILFTAFILIPIIWAFVLAFQEYGVFGSEWVGLKNFESVAKSELFRSALWNTLQYTVVTVPLQVLIALGLATLIHPLGRLGQSFFRGAFYLPTVTSMVIIAMVWRWVYNYRYGLFNYMLSIFGLPTPDWLNQSSTALWALIIMSVLIPPGVGIIMYLAAMGSIPEQLYEAAEIDGANGFQRWWRITVPLLKPTTLYLTMLSLIGSFQVFTQILLMTGGGPGHATETLVSLVYKTAFRDLEFGLASAQAIVLFVITLLFGIAQYWLLYRKAEED
ncbi:carbohydrate ABC transporter permease [Tumebacillus permanentifrigoris]|uniref:Carbohydrate ABC transporter membrane protein 1 (CUT1 family) n=1 Tax=Tumebacillus permanentifrigoris TaxID=378543 RepID=A0A316DYQ2_9BACL|nr:sugar ABC transporter permease [Tumebacillus permanentifrigoris]PWK15630.1 carbohydrate ABC transporter membrane protein 1 (CUT1 family) [Tumebacillus permanentifrigoris]